jgi:hypothetical protein
MFGATAQPDLVGGDGGEDLIGMELLGTGWCLRRWSHPPFSLFRLGGVLGALVAVLVVRRTVPR